MKIGVFGGAFDPIHIGHIELLTYAKKALDLDKVLLIPTGNNPWKQSSIASDEQRIDMIRLASKKHDFIEIETMEIEQKDTKNYTIYTLEKLKQQYPNDQLYFIMGYDHVEKFHLWKDADKISNLVSLVAFHRGGYSKTNDNLDTYHFKLLDMEPLEISSSEIREGKIQFLHKDVLQYICMNGIYLDTIIETKMSKKRYEHTVSMANLAREIAISNHLNPTKAYVAGMFHDIAKEIDKKEAKKLMKKHYPKHIDKAQVLYHQWLGAYVAKHIYHIKDKEILSAIASHTTGSLKMSKLAMTIYVADKYDPYRGYDSSQEINLCKQDIEKGFKQCLIDFYEFSKKQNRPIDESFYEIYDFYVTKGEENE